MFIAGAAVQWLRDGLKLAASASELARMAESVPDTADVMFVPALVGLGARIGILTHVERSLG